MRNFKKIFRKDVTFDNIKSHKKPGLQGNWVSCKITFVFKDNPIQNIWRKIKKSSEFRRERQTLISTFAYFNIYLHKRGWTLDCDPMQF